MYDLTTIFALFSCFISQRQIPRKFNFIAANILDNVSIRVIRVSQDFEAKEQEVGRGQREETKRRLHKTEGNCGYANRDEEENSVGGASVFARSGERKTQEAQYQEIKEHMKAERVQKSQKQND